MPTNKPVLRSAEQFMSDYSPIYRPIYPLFLGKSQAYPKINQKMDTRRIVTAGDIRAKRVTPKDTEIRQISAMEQKKTFKEYFLMNQYRESNFQDHQGMEEVAAQVLDEHQKQMDDMLLLGEGTSDSDVVNNGLFWSGDPNHTTEGSTEVQKDSDGNYAVDLYAKVMTNAQKANQVAGRKVIIFYGSNILPVYNGLFPNGQRAFKAALAEGLGNQYSTIDLPEAVTPSSAQGFNEEVGYVWMNFLLSSCMLEVLALNGVVKQPATLEA
jgi:hypothetical protein